MKRRGLNKLCDECDDLRAMFEKQPAYDAKEELEKRYKILVLTILPHLFIMLNISFRAVLFFLGLALVMFFKG